MKIILVLLFFVTIAERAPHIARWGCKKVKLISSSSSCTDVNQNSKSNFLFFKFLLNHPMTSTIAR